MLGDTLQETFAGVISKLREPNTQLALFLRLVLEVPNERLTPATLLLLHEAQVMLEKAPIPLNILYAIAAGLPVDAVEDA